MVEINALLVKKLRSRTGLGVMECKKALIEAKGDIEIAIENIRKSGVIKAAKKADTLAANGVIGTKILGNRGIIIEVNCQTDFAARGILFQRFVKKIIDTAITNKINDVDLLRTQFENERIELVSRIGENVKIRRLGYQEGELLGTYQHGKRIGVLVSSRGHDQKFIQQLAMHIAASKPEFLKPEDIPAKMLEKEYRIQWEIATQLNKSKEIVQKIVEGRIKKFTEEITLIGQSFIMNPNKSVRQLIKEHDVEITGFIRFEVAEGIENTETNFAIETSNILSNFNDNELAGE